MGGMGSGRRCRYGKDTTEDSLPLDIRRLHRAGWLKPGRSFQWEWTINGKRVAGIDVRVEVQHVGLSYRHRPRGDVDWQNVEQAIYLDHTVCAYGGTRPWWICPSCSRRVAVLYSPGKLYACRHCCELVYSSQRETFSDRAMRRADKIRGRLGWPIGIGNPKGLKPRGMHWRTFAQLNARYDELAWRSLAVWAQRLGILKNRMG
jgi:hypothetical protein